MKFFPQLEVHSYTEMKMKCISPKFPVVFILLQREPAPFFLPHQPSEEESSFFGLFVLVKFPG